MRSRSMGLLLGASLCALASGCVVKTHHDPSTQPVVTPPLVQNPPGTTLNAKANSGFLSATLTGALGAPLAFAVDNQTQSAAVTQYSNGNVGVTAPDISPTKGQDQVTFTQFFTQQTPVQAAGGGFATGTSAAGASVTLYQGQTTLDLQYSDFGIWTSAATKSSAAQVLGAYAIGNTTSSAGLPKSGSLVFTGNALGTIASTQGSGVFGGLASLTVNFSNNQVSGSISDVRAATSFTTLPIGSVNAITLAGSVNGASFTGTATAGSGTGTAFDISGASGSLGGNLYGTNATEAGGTFSLTGGANQAQVIGSFGATQSFVSTNVSSTLPQISSLPNGTPLTGSSGSGFLSATQTVATTLTTGQIQTSFAIDGTSTTGGTVTTTILPANLVFYSNGTISLQAPDIPYFNTQQTTSTDQTVQFAGSSFTQSSNGGMAATSLPYGTVQASAVSSVPGNPSIAGDQVTLYRVGGNVGLQYSDFGEWVTGQQPLAGGTTTSSAVSSYGVYGVGVATPTSQMPTTGSALYTGSAIGVLGYAPAAAGSQTVSMTVTNFTGVAELNANFASGAISGGIYGVRAGPANYLNDILFTGGKITGNGFAGSASVGTNIGSIDLTGAAGKFAGGFYGPSAKEITGTFSLSGTSTNGVQLIGAFGAHK